MPDLEKKDDNPNAPPASTTGASGKHPVGVGIGAVAGGVAAGAAMAAATGTLAAGPVGTLIGAVVGAVAGGLGGRAIAEHFDPNPIDRHWRDRYQSESYYRAGLGYEHYAPAYHLGAHARQRDPDWTWDEADPVLENEYGTVRGKSDLSWSDVKEAVRASFHTTYV